MFIDKVKIEVIAGKGGDGLVAFRREKYVPLGGPSGGDGGKGGDVIVMVDTNKSTLLDLSYQRRVVAKNGEHGKNKKMHGADGKDVILKVPLGTVFIDANSKEVLADLVHVDQRVIIAKGGAGGQGNARYKSSRNPAPDYAQRGALGEQREVQVELKLLADVGLIGFPSVGKSTLLSVISAAKPEIAPYHFTTIVPNLGVVGVGEYPAFVVADMPGLIEGAALGKGLGIQFLRHIERTKLLVHIIDMGAQDFRDPIADYRIINAELKNYTVDLSDRPQIVVANKMDLPNAQDNLKRFKEAFPDLEIFEISAVIKDGLDALLYKMASVLEELKKQTDIEQEAPTFTYTLKKEKPRFEVVNLGNHEFRLTGEALINKYRQYDFENEASALQFAYVLKRWGVDKALKSAGAEPGDVVIIENLAFVFEDSED